MKKIYLKAYLKHNLGDDLFVYIIANRYKNVTFKTILNKNYNLNINNLDVCKTGFRSKLITLISLKKYSLERLLMKKSDASVLIGGSLFIEKKNELSKKYYLGEGHPYYIMGSNFGPYKTKQYYDKIYNMLKDANDVCFRDKYSYDLFKTLDNVRIAPDIVFSFDASRFINNDSKKKVVISVIDCTNRNIKNNKEKYENKIIEMINYFQSNDYKVTLMSFCKYEGDEKAIDSIISKVNNVEKYYYNGDLNGALGLLGESDIIVGSRFHANILGLVMNKTIIPIAYSDKTINTLNDINFKGRILDIRNIDEFDVSTLSDLDLNYKLNIDKYRKEAEKHFKELDRFLKND